MKMPVVTLLSVAVIWGLVITSGHAGSPSQADPTLAKFVGGTIEEMDPAGLRVTIQTERGKKETFPIADASMLMGLTKGDRVSAEMDDQGKVLKIVKLAPHVKGRPDGGG